MESNKNLEIFLSFLMMKAQRKRTNLVHQLSTAEIYKPVYEKRKLLKKLFISQTNVVPTLLFTANVPRFRSVSKKPRSDDFWCTLQKPENKDLHFNAFRMGKDSFTILCKKLEPFLKTDWTSYVVQPIPIEKQVGIGLYKLASCAEYRVVGEVFGIHKSTVHKYFHLVIDAILQLKDDLINFPKLHQALEIADAFQKQSSIPNIIGVIEATHIPISIPAVGSSKYVNRKGWISIIMQGVVDNNFMFTDVNVKLPGSSHVATVLKDSNLYKNCGNIIPKDTKLVNNVQMPLFMVGNASYPLLPWLMKPYVGKLSCEEEFFNCQLNSALFVAQKTFRRLKGRWRCLTKKIDVGTYFVKDVVLACAILHNFAERQKEPFLDSWTVSDREYSQPRDACSNESICEFNFDPKELRTVLKNHLKENF